MTNDVAAWLNNVRIRLDWARGELDRHVVGDTRRSSASDILAAHARISASLDDVPNLIREIEVCHGD